MKFKRQIVFYAALAVVLVVFKPQTTHAQCTPAPNITCDSDPGAFVNGSAADDTIIITVNVVNPGIAVLGGDGNDVILNAGTHLGVDGQNDNDVISNTGNIGNVYGDNGDDVLSNSGTITATLNGNANNDIISNSGTVDLTINGDDGDDVITNSGDTPAINGGANNDVIVLLDGSKNSGGTQTLDGGVGDFDTLQFNFSASEQEAADFNAQLAAVLALNPTCNTGAADACAGIITFRGQAYDFSNFEQLVNLLSVIATETQATGSNFNPAIPRIIFDNRIIKVFQIFNDQEFYGGFSPELPNGFLIAKIPASELDFNACKNFQDPNSPWYLVACPERNLFRITVFDQNGNLITEFLSPVLPARTSSTAATGGNNTSTTNGSTSNSGFTANPYLSVGDRGVALDGVIVRESPSLTADSTGEQILWGEFVTILAEDNSGFWFLVVTDGGVEGWVANEWFAPPGQFRPRGGAAAPNTPR